MLTDQIKTISLEGKYVKKSLNISFTLVLDWKRVLDALVKLKSRVDCLEREEDILIYALK